MIKGVVKEDISIESVLERVNDYEVYKYYLGHDFKIGMPFSSPFRRDSNPSFCVGVSKSGKLKHIDFGDSTKRGDCIDFVTQLLSLSYKDALRRVYLDLCKNTYSKVSRPLVAETEQKTIIQVVTRKFDTADLKYWGDYHITHKELRDNDVYAVKKLYLNRSRIMISPTELVFGYLMDNRWKIYRPLADKKSNKFITNVPNSYMSGLHRIMKGCDIAVITKAKKDEILLSKFLPHVASVQSESEMSISKANIDLLSERCGTVYLNFDSDEVGVQACKYYNQFGFRWINCPRGYLKPDGSMIKDFSDLAKYHGLEEVIQHFKTKGLLSWNTKK